MHFCSMLQHLDMYVTNYWLTVSIASIPRPLLFLQYRTNFLHLLAYLIILKFHQ